MLIADHSQGVSKEAQVGSELACHNTHRASSCHVQNVSDKDEQKANKLTYYDFKAILQFAAHGSCSSCLFHINDAQKCDIGEAVGEAVGTLQVL